MFTDACTAWIAGVRFVGKWRDVWAAFPAFIASDHANLRCRGPPGFNRGRKMSRKRPLEGIDPTKPFYLALTIGNLDGSRDELGSEGFEGEWDTAEEAVRELRGVNEDYPTLDGYVYHCIPVAKVWRGKVRVTKLGQSERTGA